MVTQFDVEFVDLQFQPPLPRQLRFGPTLVSPNLIHMAVRLIGPCRKYTPMAEEQQRLLATELYNAFVGNLRSRGVNLLPREALQSSPAYVESRRGATVRSSPLMVLNVVGSDTGTVLHTRTVAAPGLCVPRECLHGNSTVDTRILREAGADAALAVRLRVGLFRGKPAMEQRSTIRLTTCDGSTTLRACHSLVSDLVVTTHSRFRPIVGWIQQVDAGAFSGELTAMVPTFLDLALSESKP